MIIGEVGCLAPLAGSADTANSSPDRSPDTMTGAVIRTIKRVIIGNFPHSPHSYDLPISCPVQGATVPLNENVIFGRVQSRSK